MIIAFIGAGLVLTGLLGFLWHRLAVAPGWANRWVRPVVAVLIAVLFGCALAGFDAWGGQFSPATMRPIVWVGQAFLASLLYLFLGLIPVWLISVVLWLVGRRGDHGRVARRRLNRIAVPLIVTTALVVTAYGAVEASRIQITPVEARSPQLPAQFDGAKVALLTDLHAGAVRSAAFTQQVVDLTNAQRPDVILIAGDLEDGYANRYAPELAPLADLRAPLGVFVTTGNHEMYRDTVNWVREFKALGLTVLANQSVPLTRDGATITVAGVHDWQGVGEFAPDYDSALADTDPAGYSILMAHQPRQALAVQGRGVDLQVSGHTHGGQMWPLRYLVPLQQPVIDGFHPVGDVPVMTSRGAGAWGPAIRVGAPPQIPIITLRRG